MRKILTIIKDEEFLRKTARIVKIFDKKLWQLLDDMRDTMENADGVGLAAPQIGFLKRVAIVSVDYKDYYELINPEILSQHGEKIGDEGCLSVPKTRAAVSRPTKIEVEYFDRNGAKKTLVAEDLLARAICHEVDHLNGILFVDRIVN